MPPQPPAAGFSSLLAFVSPVTVKKNCWKCESGANAPFSGRLNGGAVRGLGQGVRVVRRRTVGCGVVDPEPLAWSVLLSAACEANVIGWPADGFVACSTCNSPLLRSPREAGTK